MKFQCNISMMDVAMRCLESMDIESDDASYAEGFRNCRDAMYLMLKSMKERYGDKPKTDGIVFAGPDGEMRPIEVKQCANGRMIQAEYFSKDNTIVVFDRCGMALGYIDADYLMTIINRANRRECKNCEYCDLIDNICLLDESKCYKDGKCLKPGCEKYTDGTWTTYGNEEVQA